MHAPATSPEPPKPPRRNPLYTRLFWFIAGAGGASLVWFAALGYGARWLAPWFARPRAWQLLDGLIGVTMFVLSAMLVRLAFSGI